MTDARVIKATYADWKPVKTRASLQIILEVPIEDTEKVMKMLGVPIPGQEKWVAVALLDKSVSGRETAPATDDTPSKPESGGKKWHEMSRAQQAGILCADPKFQEWVKEQQEGPIDAAEFVRWFCNVRSRADLDTTPTAFNDLVTSYRRDTGQMAEVR